MVAVELWQGPWLVYAVRYDGEQAQAVKWPMFLYDEDAAWEALELMERLYPYCRVEVVPQRWPANQPPPFPAELVFRRSNLCSSSSDGKNGDP